MQGLPTDWLSLPHRGLGTSRRPRPAVCSLQEGAIIAIFNASLAITLQIARVVFAGGRDRAWPGPIGDALSQVFRSTDTPSVATGVVGVLATEGAPVVTFTAVLIITLYALIAISALVSRVRQRDLPRPYAMPLWPLPPIVAWWAWSSP